MKKLITLFILAVFGMSSNASAYEYKWELPYCLDANYTYENPQYARPHHLIPVPTPPEYLKQKPGPNKMMTSEGVELVNISQSNSHISETWISVNPLNNKELVVGANDWRYNNPGVKYRMGAFYSTDAGKTWGHSTTPPGLDDDSPIEYPSGGSCTMVDPGLAYDSEGNPYYIYLMAQLFGEDGAGNNAIFVTKSTNKGNSWIRFWNDNDGDEATVKFHENELQDKCFMAADDNPESPYKDRLYAAWFNTDRGGTDYPYVDISYFDPEEGEWSNSEHLEHGNVQSPLPVVGPEGEVYVTWESKEGSGSSSKTKAMFCKSTNGGESWMSAIATQRVNTCGTPVGYRLALEDKYDMRISSHPSMAVNRNNGYIYIVQPGKNAEQEYGIFLTKSTDRGESWSGSVNLEDLYRIDNGDRRNDRFMAAVAVDQETGMVAVGYYSSQNSEDNTGCDYYVAISFDDAETWNHIQVTDTWTFVEGSVVSAGSANLGQYWGDYSSIAAAGGNIYPCFWMPKTAKGNFWQNDIFTALLSSNPKAPANPAFQRFDEDQTKLKLTWEDPTTNLLGAPLGEFKIIISDGNNKIAEVDAGIQEYIFENAIDGQVYNFNFIARTTAGLESPASSISVQAGGNPTALAPTGVFAVPTATGFTLYWTNPSLHVDNTPLHDLDKIYVYKDKEETPFHTIEKADIQAGGESSMEITIGTEQFYALTLKAVTSRGTTLTVGMTSLEFIAYAGSPVADIDEDFEGAVTVPFFGGHGWATTDEANAGETGNRCFTDLPNARYLNRKYTRTILAPIVVTDENKTLNFDHIAVVDDNDFCVLSISNDYGRTWKYVHSWNWDSYEHFNSSLEASDWQDEHFNLDYYGCAIGETAMIRFTLAANNIVNKDGWFIDNIKLDDTPGSIKDANLSLMTADVSPNPTTDQAVLTLNVPAAGDMHISLYDNMGRYIQTISEDYTSVGTRSVDMELANLASGLYFCRINLNGAVKTVPVVINE